MSYMLIIIATNYFVLPVLSPTVLFISKKKKKKKKKWKNKIPLNWEEVKVSLHTLNTYTMSSHTMVLTRAFLPF